MLVYLVNIGIPQGGSKLIPGERMAPMLMEVEGGKEYTKLGVLQRICEFIGGDSKETKYTTSRSTREAQEKHQQQVDKQVDCVIWISRSAQDCRRHKGLRRWR